MVIAGYVIELAFSALHIIPTDRNVTLLTSGISWNYTTFLNIGFLILTAILLWRFLKTNGFGMLTMMGNKKSGNANN